MNENEAENSYQNGLRIMAESLLALVKQGGGNDA
jgi:hypothetical protein